MRATSTAFALPDRLAAKASPTLIATDARFFARLAASLDQSVADLTRQHASALARPETHGQAALERDLEVQRLSARLRALRRYGLDLCLGRMVEMDAAEPTYIGRFGLTDADGGRLLVDWRSPAAEPFFGATHANPMGLASRRRYHWTGGRVTDYWDEVFTAEGLEGAEALDDQSAFIASLGRSRSGRMRDVLGTIQADQDAIIRAGSRGTLVVDGGPGTGKTVVALHRTAYLLYSDPRLAQRRGGVLFVGPHPAYLSYVEDVLPALGEEGVQLATLRGLVPEGPGAVAEADPEVARLKATSPVIAAVEAAVRLSERPPTESFTVETPWADIVLEPADWAEAFTAPDPGSRHNEAREQVWEELRSVIADRLADEEVPEHILRRSLDRNEELRQALDSAWPILDPTALVADLLSRPALLQRCAPTLTAAEVSMLQRPDPRVWTVSDLPILDAARQRIGDPHAAVRRRQRETELADERERMDRVVDDLIAADDSELKLMMMLRGQDAQNSLATESALTNSDPDELAGPFAHIVVDEAQELTDAQWGMLVSRCPSRSFTIVGDRAQARHGFAESWEQRLARVGLGPVTIASLTINYRTPEEVMLEAEPIIRAALPDANVPTSIRSSGMPVRHGRRDELEGILDSWIAEHPEGVACVIGDSTFEARPRIHSMSPVTAKGLEFDLVVLVDPEDFGEGIEGAVDRYVAMTRATQRLVVLTS